MITWLLNHSDSQSLHLYYEDNNIYVSRLLEIKLDNAYKGLDQCLQHRSYLENVCRVRLIALQFDFCTFALCLPIYKRHEEYEDILFSCL